MYVQQTNNPTHWGQQKTFGGPHAARGPQFGHLCYKTFEHFLTSVKATKLGT